jgi:dihydrofolate synthase/folylpolyglutamate synthase
MADALMAPSYRETLTQLFARSALGMRPGLETISLLLQALQHPAGQTPYILVAGTNGKGSTCRFLAGALQAAGHKVGLFTSPHLLTYRERITIDGAPITEDEVIAYSQQIVAAETTLPRPATFFEASTAMACLAFARHAVDIAVVEVGLGGRLDATNALPDATRIATIITPIDLDHMHMLGQDRVTIAHEKAGILRRHVPVVFALQWPSVAEALTQRARTLGCPITYVPAVTPVPTQVHSGQWLPGYLQQNLATATQAAALVDQLGYACPPEAMAQGAATFTWPGRYQWVEPGRPGGPSYLIDGSHNPAGMTALLTALRADSRLTHKQIHVLFGAMPHKDSTTMLTMLDTLDATVHRCSLQLAISSKGAALGVEGAATALPSAAQALARLDKMCSADDVVVVVGSLYLAGESLAYLYGLPTDPPVMG